MTSPFHHSTSTVTDDMAGKQKAVTVQCKARRCHESPTEGEKIFRASSGQISTLRLYSLPSAVAVLKRSAPLPKKNFLRHWCGSVCVHACVCVCVCVHVCACTLNTKRNHTLNAHDIEHPMPFTQHNYNVYIKTHSVYLCDSSVAHVT